VNTLSLLGDLKHFVNEAFKHCKAVGATNEGVDLLAASQIQGVAVAGPDSPAELVNELGVVTIRNAGDMGYFSQKFIEAIAQHRHWIRQNQKEMVPA
jgi:catalase